MLEFILTICIGIFIGFVLAVLFATHIENVFIRRVKAAERLHEMAWEYSQKNDCTYGEAADRLMFHKKY